MLHWLIFYNFLVLLAGLIALVLVYTIYLQLKEQLLKYYLIFLGISSIFYVAGIILFYVRITNTVVFSINYKIIIVSFRFLLSFFVLTFLIFFTIKIYGIQLKKWFKIVGSGILIFALVLPYFFLLAGFKNLNIHQIIFHSNILLRFISLVYICIIAVKLKTLNLKISNPLIVRIGRTAILFFVVLISITFSSEMIKLIIRVNYPGVEIFYLPVIYIVWVIINIKYSIKFYYQKINSAKGELLPDEFLLKFKITPREKEIIELLLSGLANKQIAAELKLSPNTVKANIYNIYQRAGITNRIGLINRIKNFTF